MITFQHSFQYSGDPAKAPFNSVTVAFHLPIYQYARTASPELTASALREGTGASVRESRVVRQPTGAFQSDQITELLTANRYDVAIPEDFVSGRDDAMRTLASEYYLKAMQDGDVERLMAEGTVQFLSADGHEIGSDTLEFICLPKLGVPTTGSVDLSRTGAGTQLRFLAVNRDAYNSLRQSLSGSSLKGSDKLILAALSFASKIGSGKPEFDDGIKVDFGAWLDREVRGGDSAAILNTIKKVFDAALYDFPLAVPEVKTVEIKGKLTVLPAAGVVLTAKDFVGFKIFAECHYGSETAPQTPVFQFVDNVTINGNAANFDLTNGGTVFRNGLQKPVTVSVKWKEILTVWSQDFSPDDAKLANLDIRVSQQRELKLEPPPKDTLPEVPKKLRGRVVTFNKDCVLKDLLVLVQAKTDEIAPWRVVGAATTDSSGNFSMPYPYGKFAKAQALVSLAPKEAADISIVTGNDRETLSDDFLYLLLNNPECPPQQDKSDCDCSDNKPNRLPDHSDLIGSDTYSQDFCGGCVNLSKPNRTISEFNYQAIVRNSDPSVANYTLTKVETGLDAVDVTLGVELSNAAGELFSVADEIRRKATELAGGSIFGLNFLNTLEKAWPHVVACRNALAQPGSSVTATVLASALDHINAAIAILTTYRTRAIADGPPGFPPDGDGQLRISDYVRDVILRAIDSLGTSARYDLTGGAATITRQHISLTNPVQWQDAPEPAEPAPVTFGTGGRLATFEAARGIRDAVNIRQLSPDSPANRTSQSPTFSQAVTVATGHILHYKAELKADGYSLGDLLYSLPLAPGQKKEIVVFDATHTLVGAESQSLAQNERLAMGLINERDITSQLAGRISESLRGSSNANTSGISAGFGTGGQGYGGTGAYGGSGSAVIGVAGGAANANSIATQDSSRDVSQFFGEKLRQSIMQNAESYRQLNASVVTTVQEGQRYAVTSEVVANHNHCHALTIMYFEVLRHYAVFQKLASVEECVFVPLLLTRFTTENIAKWRDILAPALLPMPSETYLQATEATATGARQHPLLKAFDADQRIKTHYANVDFPAGSYDDERILYIRGFMRLRVNLPRPRTRFDRILSLPITTKTVTTKEIDPEATARALLDFPKKMAEYAIKTAATGGLNNLFGDRPPDPPGIQYSTTQKEILVREAIFDTFMTLDANYENVPPAQCIRVTNFEPPPKISVPPFGSLNVSPAPLDLFAENVDDQKQWQAYADLLQYPSVTKFLAAHFKGNLISEWDDIFNTDIAPLAIEKMLDKIKLSEFAVDFASDTKYRGGERVLSSRHNRHHDKKAQRIPADTKAAGEKRTA